MEEHYSEAEAEPTGVIETDGELSRPPQYKPEPTEEPMLKEPIEESITNKRPLDKMSSTYQLEKFEKNEMLIFNHKYVPNCKPRIGTENDVKSLEETFIKYGFDVTSFDDLPKKGIMEELEEIRHTNYSDYGCLVIAVLTHGSSNGKLYAMDEEYDERDILKYFMTNSNKSLVTKPKILLIQACRGDQPLAGVKVQVKAMTELDSMAKPPEFYTLPLESDILVVHSSFFGKASHRDTSKGTWLIQTLCEEIKKSADVSDFESIMTNVKKRVAIDFENAEKGAVPLHYDKETINKQVPVTTSTLIRKLYLRKYKSSGGHKEQLWTNETNMTQFDADSKTDYVENIPKTLNMTQFDADSKTGPNAGDVFDYYKKVLSYYVKDHPNDSMAESLLNLAVAEKSKSNHVSTVMCEFVKQNCKNDYLKYVYIHI